MKKVFIDSNILIYCYSTTEIEKKAIARELINLKPVMSTQVINEFIWVMQRKYAVKVANIGAVVKNLFELFEIKGISRFTIENAIEITEKYKYSYWDSLIISSAIEADCSILYSEDLQNKQVISRKLKVMNPFID